MDDAPGSLVEQVMDRAPTCGACRVVALDGGAASGKSRLAAAAQQAFTAAGIGCGVLHLDDLLDGWPGQFTFWPRLRAGVLEPLATGRPGAYRRYDWVAGGFAGTVPVPAADVLVVEGVSAISACDGWATLRVLLQVPRPIREQRWIRRDGMPLQPEWRTWLDEEDRFFAEHPAPADVRVRWPHEDDACAALGLGRSEQG